MWSTEGNNFQLPSLHLHRTKLLTILEVPDGDQNGFEISTNDIESFLIACSKRL